MFGISRKNTMFFRMGLCLAESFYGNMPADLTACWHEN